MLTMLLEVAELDKIYLFVNLLTLRKLIWNMIVLVEDFHVL